MSIAKYIDFTFLNSDVRSHEIIEICNIAIKYGFQSVCINPTYIMLAKEILKNKNINVTSVIGYPLGANTNIVKLMEAKDAIEKGADELDVMMNIGALKDGKVQYVLNELQAIKKIANNHIVKCIIECPLLSDEEIITASKVCLNAGIEFIQTTTGFIGNIAAQDNIKLIRSVVQDKIKIKIVGSVTNYKMFKKFIEKGVDRIGTSKGIEIMKPLIKKQKKLNKKNKKITQNKANK